MNGDAESNFEFRVKSNSIKLNSYARAHPHTQLFFPVCSLFGSSHTLLHQLSIRDYAPEHSLITELKSKRLTRATRFLDKQLVYESK